MNYTKFLLLWIFFFIRQIFPSETVKHNFVSILKTGCIVRHLTPSTNILPSIVVKNQNELYTLVYGTPRFFETTKFSIFFKTTRLTKDFCNIYIVPVSTTFTELAGVMTSSGFMFSENALFIILVKDTATVWDKFQIGIDDPIEFPAIYTKLP
jgi:hypothetical protein